MNQLKKGIILFLFLGMQFPLSAQNPETVSGIVFDSISKEPLPYSTIFYKKLSAGVLTDDQGKFILLLPLQAGIDDTLVVSSLGYRDCLIPLASLKSPLSVAMQATVDSLREILVTPVPPTFYIQRAMRHMPAIRPAQPFQTVGYYFERVSENKKLLRHDEAVFKSYNPVVRDSLRRQYQVLLYRQTKEIHEMKFMKEERAKREQKENEKAEHNNRDPRTGIDFIAMSGGPQYMLWYASINRRVDDFLDSTRFRDYVYSYASFSSDDSDLLIIEFKSRHTVNHARKEGRIYIHLPTNAIMKIEGKGNFVIPVYLRPLMFVYGFSAQDLSFSGVKEYQMINEKWYFKSSTIKARVSVTKRHLFSANEHADYEGEQKFTVLKLWDREVSKIPAARRYNPERRMDKQVFKEEGMEWEEVERMIK